MRVQCTLDFESQLNMENDFAALFSLRLSPSGKYTLFHNLSFRQNQTCFRHREREHEDRVFIIAILV